MISSWLRKEENGVAVSSLTGEGIDTLLTLVANFVSASLTKVRVKIPFDAGETISHILRKGNIITKKYSPTGVVIEAEINTALLDSLKPYVQ
jgi:GTP-binding protein HflX